MKPLFFVFLCFANAMCFSQNLKPVAAEIRRLHDSGNAFKPFDFFERSDVARKYTTALRDYTPATLDSGLLQAVSAEQPETMRIIFPFQNGLITVDLYKTTVLSPDFRIDTDKGACTDYRKGSFYRGIIADDPTSLAAFSFFGNELAGLVSSAAYGDITLARLLHKENTNDYIIYSSRDLLLPHILTCASGETGQTSETPARMNPNAVMPLTTTKCVRMYYELSYTQYTELGADMTTVANWITAAHNNLAAVYANDGVSGMAVSEVFVWTTPDGYVTSDITGNYLIDFTRKRTAFNGDIACLLTGTDVGFTSAAALFGGLCHTSHGAGLYTDDGPYFASAANSVIEDFPVYSWTVHLLAHESGHVLGAAHTHDCVWNGNNTQIDDWGNLNLPEGPACYDPENPILPPLGEATIMSYGPETLSAGFGQQVAQLFVSNIENSTCLGTDCESSCTPTITGVSVTEVGLNSAKITINDTNPDAASWNIRILPGDFYTVDTNPYILTGLDPDTIYNIEVQQQCGSPFTADYRTTSHVISAGYYCDEFVYAYNWSPPPPYMYNSYSYETALYPVNSTDKVHLTVYTVNLEQDDEILNVYDGPNAEGPLLGTFTGTVSEPGFLSATGPTGALTLQFVNDGDPTTGTGWLAYATCVEAPLGVDDTAVGQIRFYPNPVTDALHVEGTETIRHVTVFDMLGRAVWEQEAGNKDALVRMEQLSSGQYVVALYFDKAVETLKIAKQ
jgi:hypothetical protein